MVNEIFISGAVRGRDCLASPRPWRALPASRKKLGQRQLSEHRGRLVGRRKAVLQRQKLARYLLRRDGFGLADDVLQLVRALGLPGARSTHDGLGGGIIGLNIRNGLLAWLGCQAGRRGRAKGGDDLRGGSP